MNIYFACSITGGREFEPAYQAISAALLASGAEVPTAHLAGSNVTLLETQVEPVEVFTRDVGWIRACDALVAEVSTPSHGVGYEIAYALSLQKPVLALYQQGHTVSKMLTGNTSAHIQVFAYPDLPSALARLQAFLASLGGL